jgi:hypothetical protein
VWSVVVLPYLFPVMFLMGIAGLVVLCLLVRRYLSRADQSRASRNAVLMAMTRVPIGPEARVGAGRDAGTNQS